MGQNTRTGAGAYFAMQAGMSAIHGLMGVEAAL